MFQGISGRAATAARHATAIGGGAVHRVGPGRSGKRLPLPLGLLLLALSFSPPAAGEPAANEPAASGPAATGSAASGLAASGLAECRNPAAPLIQVICASEAAQAAKKIYRDMEGQALAALAPASRQKLLSAQKTWLRDVPARCSLPEKGPLDAQSLEQDGACIVGALRARSAELREIAVLAAEDPAKGDAAGPSRRSWTVAPYRLVIDAVDPGGEGGPFDVLTVMQGRDWIYSQSNLALAVNPTGFFKNIGTWEDGQKPFEVGQDVLGFGVPSIAVSGFSMGAHCCFDVTLLLLGPEFRALPSLPVLDNDTVAISRKGPGPAVLALYDFSFAYWRASFANSAAPAVMLSYDPAQGQYMADQMLMRRAGPSRDELAKLVAQARAAEQAATDEDWPEAEVPREVSGPVLDLIYSGNIRQAQDFLEKAWIAGDDRRADYWRELTGCRLRKSPFWPAVAAMNGLPPDPPAGACD